MDSSGATPFGFKVNRYGFLVVSEAAGGPNGLSAVSSYSVQDRGELGLISGSVSTGQLAACWIAVIKDGEHAYSGNVGSGTITANTVGDKGALTRLNGAAGIFATGGQAPTEMAVLESRVLYVLNRNSGGSPSSGSRRTGRWS